MFIARQKQRDAMQISQVQIALDRFLASRPYHPCCMLVHRDVRRLQYIGSQVSSAYNWPVVSIGTTASTALLTIAPAERPRAVEGVLANALAPYGSGPIICTDIDLLFEPTLQINPLRLLRDYSRHAILVTLWPGTADRSFLSYATSEPPHAHHRSWPRADLCDACVIALESFI